mmetsp:Transcript_3832/g.3973  ORF Transcript_3832/g.3973 Transcript_3832/m.3973 type:complete len:255 (-) Transcript_3832:79-843(-)
MDHENAKISSKGVEELNEILSSFFSSENCAVLKELGDVLIKANLEKNDIEAVEKVGILRFPPSSFVSEDKRNVGSLINDSKNEDNTLDYIEDTENLILMMGDIPRELIQYTYSILCGRNRLETAQYLLENNDLIGIEKIKQLKNVYDKNEKDGAKLSAIQNKKTKSLICNKYGQLLVRPEFNIKGKVDKTKVLLPMQFADIKEKEKKIRYINDRVVTFKGEKKITVHNPADDYDGGSRGKCTTKGKRGPGFVMG